MKSTFRFIRIILWIIGIFTAPFLAHAIFGDRNTYTFLGSTMYIDATILVVSLFMLIWEFMNSPSDEKKPEESEKPKAPNTYQPSQIHTVQPAKDEKAENIALMKQANSKLLHTLETEREQLKKQRTDALSSKLEKDVETEANENAAARFLEFLETEALPSDSDLAEQEIWNHYHDLLAEKDRIFASTILANIESTLKFEAALIKSDDDRLRQAIQFMQAKDFDAAYSLLEECEHDCPDTVYFVFDAFELIKENLTYIDLQDV